MARKTPRKKPGKTSRKAVRKALKKARQGRAASVKGRKARSVADKKAAAGVTPPWSAAEVEEAFRRLKAAMPDPETELEHEDPYQLLGAGVALLTPASVACADTPAKMVALGEAKVRDFIKTIGLFRTKARNVVALSQKLVD